MSAGCWVGEHGVGGGHAGGRPDRRASGVQPGDEFGYGPFAMTAGRKWLFYPSPALMEIDCMV